jgi:hypothetical protein
MDVQSVESVGVNQIEPMWERGILTNGEPQNTSSYQKLCVYTPHYTSVIPNTNYYVATSDIAATKVFAYISFYDSNFVFISSVDSLRNNTYTTPNNAVYMRMYLYCANVEIPINYEGININLSDTSINGKYFPYIKRVEDLNIIRKYFPDGMKSAGSSHAEIRYNKASGKWEKVVRIGEVDMGTLNYVYTPISESFPLGYFRANLQNKAAGHNMLCFKYDAVAGWADKGIRGGDYTGVVDIKDGDYTDVASFKDAMQGVMLYYELAEPIVTELDAEDQFKDLDYKVWNAGTEKAIAEGKSAPLAADITYGFNAIGKIKELESLVAQLRAKVGI